MGLLDCVNDKRSGKYPMSPSPNQVPQQGGFGGRRSMGLFASNNNLKNKDINFWRHRLLCFLYRPEGRDDVGSVHLGPILKENDYNSVGDFIREIPAEIYEPYQAQIIPNTMLRKDFKVIWERDGIAEPGILKWEGVIQGQRCMGLQLDRKKAVPFKLYDGKGLFYCKPGHRALVPVEEVYPYKQFLRQFVGMGRKDSVQMNLLPGRSSVRIPVTKQYKPGDRVHIPEENKWATILWTGRIDGEWVVDLVFDPDKPASPDEPCMSRSLSVAEFMDKVGPENEGERKNQSRLPSVATPPDHVPPPPPRTKPPKLSEIEVEDEVFMPQVLSPTPVIHLEKEQDSEHASSEEDEVTSEDEEEDHSSLEEIHSAVHSQSAVPSPALDSKLLSLKRTESEPGSHLYQKQGSLKEPYEGGRPLEHSKRNYKPMFNLSSLGRAKKQREIKTKDEESLQPKDKNKVPSPKKSTGIHPIKMSLFISKPKSDENQKTKVRSSSVGHGEKQDSNVRNSEERQGQFQKKPRNSSGQHQELPVDVPRHMRSPDSSVSLTPTTPHPQILQDDRRAGETETVQQTLEVMSNHYVGDEGETVEDDEHEELSEAAVDEREPSECSSESTPPYSPAIKDVGLKAPSAGGRKSPKRSRGFKSFGDMFGLRKKNSYPPSYQEYEHVDRGIERETNAHSKLPNNDQNLNASREKEPAPTHGPSLSLNTSGQLKPQDHRNSVTSAGDQEFLVLESLEVQDERTTVIETSVQEPSKLVRKGSKGKSIFGFGKRSRSLEDKQMRNEPMSPAPATSKPTLEASPKRNSFRRTFSFTKDKSSTSTLAKPVSMEEVKTDYSIETTRKTSFTSKSKSRSRSASALVDIKPWDDRRGNGRDIYDEFNSQQESDTKTLDQPDSGTTSDRSSKPAPTPIPALLPKPPEPVIPKHRKFTTPIGLFNFGQKSAKTPKVKQQRTPKTTPPTKDKISITHLGPSSAPPLDTSSRSTDSRQLKSALRQRKEIDAIPRGVKVGDRVIWYNGKAPIPGTVMKLYKEGADKYTAVVKFDRLNVAEPLTLAREGDDYIVTVEELLTPELLGLPAVTSPTSPPPREFPEEEVEEPKSPTVRFETSMGMEFSNPKIAIELDLDDNLKDNNDRVPPPFQEEEVAIACGMKRGIPANDSYVCLETLLFSMFYTTNAFDTSLLYGDAEEKVVSQMRAVLRNRIVTPLRQDGFCERSAVNELIALIKKAYPNFHIMNGDASIVSTILYGRALGLGKFLSYSNGTTDYLHQLVVDTKDLSKSGTVQQLLENSLRQMENCKFKSIPSPALIIEAPRTNNKLVQYQAVIPNMVLNLSHLLENGPLLCLCGMVAKYQCRKCQDQSGEKAVIYCDTCKPMGEQIHFQLDHPLDLQEIEQKQIVMDLVAVVCVKEGHYSSFVKVGSDKTSPWLFYDAEEGDDPKVSLEQHLHLWLDRLEKSPGKYVEALVYPLLTHFLANSHIYIYKPREKSSLV